METIEKYTKEEGGEWLFAKPNFKIENEENLHLARQTACIHKYDSLDINGTRVHSFYTFSGRRWDVYNGWNLVRTDKPKISNPTPIRSLDIFEKYRIYQDYLLLKMNEQDWHGVMDAAADLREFEARNPEVRKGQD